jgi:hypothetical protein
MNTAYFHMDFRNKLLLTADGIISPTSKNNINTEV